MTRSIALFVFLISLSGCDLASLSGAFGKIDGATLSKVAVELSDTSGSAFSVFSTAVYSGVMTQARCTSCHASQVPLITAHELTNAYAVSKARMNFSDVNNSPLYVKARNIAHCSPTCLDLGATAWQEALGTWAASELAAVDDSTTPPMDPGSNDPIVYQTTAIQSTGSTGARSVSVTVPGAGLSGVSLEFMLEVSIAGDMNTSRISDFRLANASGQTLVVENIRILQGTSATLTTADLSGGAGTAYSDVATTVANGATPLLSTTQALMSKSQGLFIVFAFEVLEVAPATGCQQQARFDSTVLPVLQSKCFVCHTAGAGGAWAMSTNATTLCNQALMRANLGAPASSVLIQKPYNGQGGHSILLSSPEASDFIDWVTSE